MRAAGPRGRGPDPDQALELFLSFWIARGVLAAVELGLFDELEGEGLDLAQASRLPDLRERPARALIDTCRAVSLVEPRAGDSHSTALGTDTPRAEAIKSSTARRVCASFAQRSASSFLSSTQICSAFTSASSTVCRPAVRISRRDCLTPA